MSTAKVFLVGAGPGDPGLITARGLELLRQADVVVYDYLSGNELLAHACAGARLVDVGKKGYEEHLTQEQINALLVELAGEEGVRTIVRLKGGDPFVFGRGGEEALALRAAGVAYEVVPGVTSGVAAPTYAGIPVTHRKVSSSVTFVTGNEDPTREASGIDWGALAGLLGSGGTLCFYMGVRNLGSIAERLQASGAAPDTPVALVRWGTTPRQETLTGTLDGIACRAEEAGFAAPAIIVVGRVAVLREELAWFEDAPLFGKRIAVTRSRSQASELSSRLRALGADVLEVPTIEFAEPDSFDALDAAIGALAGYGWLVFTSVNGVDAFFTRLHGAGLDTRALAGVRVAAIGPATARRLSERGVTADVVPGEYRAEAVFEALQAACACGLAGEHVLISRAQEAREVLPQALRAAGAVVDVAPAYKTCAPPPETARLLRERLETGEVDALTFTSSSTARNLVQLLGGREEAGRLLDGAALCSIGPITSATLEELGLRPTLQASEYTIDGLVQAMEKEL